MAVITSGDDYERHFNPERYLQYMYSDPEGLGKCNRYIMQQLHKCFAGEKIKGQRLLDIGTGPTIHTIISACNKVDEVYLSDYADQNIEILNSWLKGERYIQNNMIQWVCDLENKGQSTEDRVLLMRKKVKHIFHVDITSLDSLNKTGVPTQYDIITSSWCLDSAGYVKEIYIKCVKNVFSLLKPGGYFILIGDLNSQPYRIGNTTFPLVHFSSAELRAIYESEGFDIQQWSECKYKDELYDVDNLGVEFVTFVMVALKKGE